MPTYEVVVVTGGNPQTVAADMYEESKSGTFVPL